MSAIRPLLLLLCIITIACNQPKIKGLPEAVPLSTLKQTDFVATLENGIDSNKNIIYAASFLFAWDKVKQLLNAPVVTSNSNSGEFKLLNQSDTFKNSLNDGEYEASATTDGGIAARAFFNKKLPFDRTLQKIDSGILFDNKRVMAFGMTTSDFGIKLFTRILYYENDDRFVLELTPRDTMNRIILAKGLHNIKTLEGAVKQTDDLVKKKYNDNEAWKYQFHESDTFAIPIIRFNIETNYKNLEGQQFTAGGKKQTLIAAYQRTAFSLDENGAEVESLAAAALDTIVERQHPKRMYFDKPFFIIVKHTGQPNPYFVMRIGNGELMERK